MRGCGKSESARRFAKSIVELDRDPSSLQLALLDPAATLTGPTPRLIDEWQHAPDLWNVARRLVDDRRAKGQFIFTGSSTKLNPGVLHPGSARVLRLQMRTFSVTERQISDGAYSLGNLFEGKRITGIAGEMVPLERLLDLICVGGWPAHQDLTARDALRLHNSYLFDILNLDLKVLDGPSDPKIASALLTCLAQTLGEKVPVTRLVSLIRASGLTLRHQTAQAYLNQFKALWITEEIEAWAPRLRSKYTINQSAKRYFGDASLAVSALKANSAKLIKDLKTAGFIFENFVISSLLTFMDALDGSVRYYRDESGLEVDAVLEDSEGRWGAVEIKLGFNQVDNAAETLLRFSERVDTSVMGEAAFLAIITNSAASYQRPDGVHVIAINKLGI